MNPTTNPNPNLNPGLNPSPLRPLAQGGLRQMPQKKGHLAFTIFLVLIILLAFGYMGWKWFANQQEIQNLQAQNALLQIQLANTPITTVASGISTDDEAAPEASTTPAIETKPSTSNQASVSAALNKKPVNVKKPSAGSDMSFTLDKPTTTDDSNPTISEI